MRVFVAGATGAIGRRLVPLLVANGHEVTGMSRAAYKAGEIRALGATPAIADALDRAAVLRVVAQARPEAVVHQVTALASMKSLRRFDAEFAATNRLRTCGLDNLLAAALAVGARRFIAQSYTNWTNAPEGGPVKDEKDPLDPCPPRTQRRTLEAIEYLERTVTEASEIVGLALRYGNLYGPGTSLGRDGVMVRAVVRRRFPVVGDGAGVWSFCHVDDAAKAALLALTHGAPGVYNITDDEPAQVAVWLPELARIVGADPPRRVPAWLGRLALGEAGLSMMTRARGSSNQRAKRVLGWSPRHASWRSGFRHELRGIAAQRRELRVAAVLTRGSGTSDTRVSPRLDAEFCAPTRMRGDRRTSRI
jgi:nucleoside-diphosphate-sugar epimerase